MGSPPGVGRRRSWGSPPLAAISEEWHAEQRAESGHRARVGNRALALLATAGVVACLIVLGSGSFLGGGKDGSLRRYPYESGRRMAAEVPFGQLHTLAAGVLVETGQQHQAQLMPKLTVGSSEGGEQEPADKEEEEEEEEEGDEEEAAEEAEAAEEVAAERDSEAAAGASNSVAAAANKRSGGSASGEALEAEGESSEAEAEGNLLAQKESVAQAKRRHSEDVEAAQRSSEGSQPGKRQAAAASGAARNGGAQLAAAEQQRQQGVGGEDKEAAEGGSGGSSGSKVAASAGGRKAGVGSKAGAAEPAEPAEPAEEDAAQQQRRRKEAAARSGQVSLTAGASAGRKAGSQAASSEPAGGKAAAAAGQAAPKGSKNDAAKQRPPEEEQAPAGPKSPYHLALERCNDLACLRDAAKQERGPGQFLFPHALVIGWQKSAAAGLFSRLAQHPGVLAPQEQESEFFSKGCDSNPAACPHEEQQEYIQHILRLQRALRQGLRKPVIEGSTRYAAEGLRMAQGLHEAFPRLKLVASLREPISRAVAVLASAKDEASQACLSVDALFPCLKKQLPALNYTAQLTAWLDAFPADQVMVMQYEALVSPDRERVAAQLSSLHKFLGLEPTAASAGGSLQLREPQPGTRTWRIKSDDYQALVKLVRPDAKKIADIVAQRGFGDSKQWLKNWEKVWQATLNTCRLDGNCTIRLV